MEEEIGKLLLNGVPLPQFIAFYIAGSVGAVFSFAINVGSDIKKDKATPGKFSKAHFKVKIWRFVSAIITLALIIVFNKEILGFLLASEGAVELTLWSSFVSGMGADRIGKRIAAIKK